MTRRVPRWLALYAALSVAPGALADGPLGPNGSELRTSQYNVDLTQGVVLAGTRVLGLAGAFVAIAEGVDGSSQNPAAPAVRAPHSFGHSDYDLGLGLTFPGSLSNTDFFNSGRRTDLSSNQADFVFSTVAGVYQQGSWGFGLSFDFQQYRLTRLDDAGAGVQADQLFAQFGGARLQVARSFLKEQLVVGVGSRGTGLVVQNRNPAPGQAEEIFRANGAALELGAVLKPHDERYRLGVALRSEVLTGEPDADTTRQPNGDRVLGDPANSTALWLPSKVILPWDVNVGVAVQFGPRPLNPRWLDPRDILAKQERTLRHRERERERKRAAALRRVRKAAGNEAQTMAALDAELRQEAALDEQAHERAKEDLDRALRERHRSMARFYILVSTSLLVTGPVERAVGVESFLQRRVDRSGEQATFSPRLGVESEVVPNRLKLRAGSYAEPTRFEGGSYRVHGTFGTDIKVLPWTVFGLFHEDTHFKVSGALDAARHYLGWGVSVGVWH